MPRKEHGPCSARVSAERKRGPIKAHVSGAARVIVAFQSIFARVDEDGSLWVRAISLT